MNNPILSIYVATYNHEHYITQALDSILMQETKYTYEVLVGEDCSTDNTRAILKEYEKRNCRPDSSLYYYGKPCGVKCSGGLTPINQIFITLKTLIALTTSFSYLKELGKA